MDLDHALRVFRLYCHRLEQDRSSVDSMLLTDNERETILKLEEMIRSYAGLIAAKQGAVTSKAA